MNQKTKQLLINILVAICSVIVTFFSSCSTIWIRGNDNNPVIDVSPKVSSDSTSFIRVGYDNHNS